MEVVNLEKYGMFWSLDPETMTKPVPDNCRIAKAVKDKNFITFMNKDETNEILSLNITKEIDNGSYGIIYMTDGFILGSGVIIKIIPINECHTIKMVASEVISQILIVNISENIQTINVRGPFAPRLHLLAKDEKYFYIVSEYMRYNFHKLIQNESVETLKNGIIQAATILQILYDKLKFNHRDFNPNNIMFNKEGEIRLIDYGFCYLEYGSIKICPEYLFPKDNLLNTKSKSRDLCALFYYILHYTKYKYYTTRKCSVKMVLNTLLYDTLLPIDWESSFTVYDSQGDIINLTPDAVLNVFNNLIFETDTDSSVVNPMWVCHIKDISSKTLLYLETNEITVLNKELAARLL